MKKTIIKSIAITVFSEEEEVADFSLCISGQI